MPTPEEQFRIARGESPRRVIEHPATAPTHLKLTIAANLTGVGVRIAREPSRNDPLGQKGNFEFHFSNLDSALEELPWICLNAIADLAVENAPGIGIRRD